MLARFANGFIALALATASLFGSAGQILLCWHGWDGEARAHLTAERHTEVDACKVFAKNAANFVAQRDEAPCEDILLSADALPPAQPVEAPRQTTSAPPALAAIWAQTSRAPTSHFEWRPSAPPRGPPMMAIDRRPGLRIARRVELRL